jgi:hypothetical protein
MNQCRPDTLRERQSQAAESGLHLVDFDVVSETIEVATPGSVAKRILHTEDEKCRIVELAFFIGRGCRENPIPFGVIRYAFSRFTAPCR